jgi:O-antigen/teichoic acid export membrane protein
MSFFKNIVSVFSSRILIRVISFGTTIVVARVLGPSGQGKIALAVLVPIMLSQIFGLELEVSNTYYTARKKDNEGFLIGNSLLYVLLVSPPAILLFVIFYDFISQTFLSGLPFDLVIIAVLIFPISFFTTSLRGIILGKERFGFYNLLMIVVTTVTFILVLIYLVFLKKGIYECLASYLIGYISGFIILLIWYIFPRIKEISISFKLLRKQLWYGFKPYISNLFSLLTNRIDLLLISYYLSIEKVGIYAIAIGMVNRMQELPHSIQTVFFPKTTTHTDEEANVFTPKLFRQTGLIMVGVGLVTGILVWFLLPLIFGSEFAGAVVPFIIILAGRIMIRGNFGILSTDLNGRGMPQFVSLVSVMAFLLSIIFNVFAIPRWGIIGASCATSINAVIQILVILIIYKRITGMPFRNFIPKVSDVVEIYDRSKDNFMGIFKKMQI